MRGSQQREHYKACKRRHPDICLGPGEGDAQNDQSDHDECHDVIPVQRLDGLFGRLVPILSRQ